MSVLRMTNVRHAYGETPVLSGINLSVEEGEFVAILGFSGSGKTTLMNLLAGLETPTSGTIEFRGNPVTEPGRERGLVFQSYSLMPWLTVKGNVALAVDAVHKDKRPAERTAIIDKYIDMVGLSHAADRRPAELSGGMRQRVA
ncbi:MAG: ABC transporter ATP-binding protein, partial [Pseudomonadota bacterium]